VAGDEAYLHAKFSPDPSVWPQNTNVTDRQDRKKIRQTVNGLIA